MARYMSSSVSPAMQRPPTTAVLIPGPALSYNSDASASVNQLEEINLNTSIRRPNGGTGVQPVSATAEDMGSPRSRVTFVSEHVNTSRHEWGSAGKDSADLISQRDSIAMGVSKIGRATRQVSHRSSLAWMQHGATGVEADGGSCLTSTTAWALATYLRWKLVLRVTPLATGAIALRLCLEHFFGFQGYFPLADSTYIFTCSIFVIGLMLHGVMADYKESERAPGALVATCEGLEDSVVTLHAVKGLQPVTVALRTDIAVLLDSVLDWLANTDDQHFTAANATLTRLSYYIEDIERAGGVAHCSRLLGEITNIRQLLTRIKVIRNTDYLGAAKPILELFVVSVTAVTVISSYPSRVLCLVSIFFVTTVYAFLFSLINDIDNPFSYEPNGPAMSVCASAIGVDLLPVLDYRQRLRVQLRASKPASRAVN